MKEIYLQITKVYCLGWKTGYKQVFIAHCPNRALNKSSQDKKTESLSSASDVWEILFSSTYRVPSLYSEL